MSSSNLSEEELFDAAIQLHSKEERRAYLRRICGSDEALRSSVEALVEFYEQASDRNFLSAETAPRPILIPEPDSLPAPNGKIGRYRVLEKIAEGGFGIVYLAEQVEPIVRRVALKVIKLGMDTREVMARFDAERQALALMSHPNIANVLDAGATETGRPYFVMEWIQGHSITRHCDEHRVSLRERLRLFESICSAVQHAHQRGIVHRDLKPSNVLITVHDGQAIPKVIDFGIAKAIDQRLTDQSLHTRQQQLIGTPAYMSPEQAAGGGDIDTRSDIYSLGVLLYELLTGTTPLDVIRDSQDGYEAVGRKIRDHDAAKPSSLLSGMNRERQAELASLRGMETSQLSRQVRGDLDWIVLKALSKERSRRYESASDFARDIQNFLRDEPVSAVAPGRAYFLSKMARRHKTELAVLSFVALVLIFSSLFGLWTARQATSAREDAVLARNRAERASAQADQERNRARLLSSQSDRQLADELLKRNDVTKALLYLARSLKSDPQNAATFRRLMSTLTQRPIALHSHPRTGLDAQAGEARFSPDGSRLVLVDDDSTLVFIDASSGKRVRSREPLARPERGVGVYFTHDGARVITLEVEGGGVRLWNMETGESTGAPFHHEPFCYHLAITPDDGMIITTGGDGRIRIWNPATGREVCEPILLSTPQKKFGLAASGRKLLVPQGYEDQIEIWDLAPGRAPARSPKQFGTARAYFAENTENRAFLDDIHPNGEILIFNRFSPESNKSRTKATLSAWNILSGEMEWETDSIGGAVTRITWSEDGTRLLILDSSGKPEIRSGLNGALIKSLPLRHIDECWEGSDHQSWIAADRQSGRIHFWERDTGQPVMPPVEVGGSAFTIHQDPAARGLRYYFSDSSRGIGHVGIEGRAALAYRYLPEIKGRFSDIAPDWKSTAWIDSNGELQLVANESGAAAVRLAPNRNGFAEARFSRDGRSLVTLSRDRRSLVVRRITDLEVTASMTLQDEGRIGLWGASLDAKLVAFLADGPGEYRYPGPKRCYIWDTQSKAPPSALPPVHGRQRLLAVSPDGEWVLLINEQGNAHLLERESEWRRVLLPRHEPLAFGAFAHRSPWLALASPGAGLKFLDLEKREWMETLPTDAEIGPADYLCFSEDDRLLLVTSAGAGSVWDWRKGEVTSDRLQLQLARSARFSPTGDRLLLEEPSGPFLVDLAPSDQVAPDWLYPFVEIYTGIRFDEAGKVRNASDGHLNDAVRFLENLPQEERDGELGAWCRWVTSDWLQRTLSPRARVLLSDHVKRLLRSDRDEEIREAWQLAPFNPEAMSRLAWSFQRRLDNLEHVRRAQWLLGKASELSRPAPTLFLVEALALQKSGRFDDALSAIERAIAAGSDYWMIYRTQASLLERLNRPEDAFKALDTAMTLLAEANDPRDQRELDYLRYEKIGLLRRTGQFERIKAIQDEIFAIPPRDPGTPPGLIDLSSYYNAGLSRDWHGTVGASLASLPAGIHELHGTPFDIRGIIQLQCALMSSHPDHTTLTNYYPAAVRDIAVHRKASRMHFLQGSLFGSSIFAPRGTLVVSYVFHYVDGTREALDLRLGEQTRDWWTAPAAWNAHFTPERGLELVWRGTISDGNVGLFRTVWENPHPELEIDHIDLISAMNTPGPFVLAITAE